MRSASMYSACSTRHQPPGQARGFFARRSDARFRFRRSRSEALQRAPRGISIGFCEHSDSDGMPAPALGRRSSREARSGERGLAGPRPSAPSSALPFAPPSRPRGPPARARSSSRPRSDIRKHDRNQSNSCHDRRTVARSGRRSTARRRQPREPANPSRSPQAPRRSTVVAPPPPHRPRSRRRRSAFGSLWRAPAKSWPLSTTASCPCACPLGSRPVPRPESCPRRSQRRPPDLIRGPALSENPAQRGRTRKSPAHGPA